MQLQLENTTFCQASCLFCPHAGLKRPKLTMELELHRKIVDEAATIALIDQFTITGLGEPLLDRNLIEKISYTSKTMDPSVGLDIYTNGNLLTVDIGKRLADAGLKTLMISMNAMRADKRREIMGLDDFKRVSDVAHELTEIFDGSGSMGVVVKAIVTKDLLEGDEQIQFMKDWGGAVGDGGHAFLHLEGNWAGKNYKVRTTQTTPCSRAMSSIMVLADGRVCLCCQDAEGEVIFGDLHTETLREIYEKEEYVRLRQMHMEGKRNELFLCKDCAMI